MFFIFSVVFIWFPEVISSAVVTLDSIEINKTHDWLRSEPTVYFHCKEENKTDLPDVKKVHVVYNFKGEESWQPLTEFLTRRCKRCGLYEKDTIKSDYVFDEWEFCPSDFTTPDGRYIRFKDKEFNATFLCQECVPQGNNVSSNASSSHSGGNGESGGHGENGMFWVIIVVISVFASTVFVVGLISGYKYWQKRKRQQEQARFLKLFEDADDIEDELGIGPLSSSI